MTATERVRELLDERDVEWLDDSYAQLWCTVWDGQDGKQWRMTENQSGMLTELKAWKVTPEQAIAATLGSCNCTNDCTNGERTETCHADETEHIDISWQDGRHLTIHVMECSECGRTYEHVNGGYEFCPRCGRRIEVNDG